MSAELASNMEDMLGLGRPDGFAAHHIVPHTRSDPNGYAVQLRQLLANQGVHPNECANGVYLPHSQDLADAYPGLGPYHRTIHTNEYIERLWNKLSPHSQATPDEFRDQLQKIAYELNEGTFYD